MDAAHHDAAPLLNVLESGRLPLDAVAPVKNIVSGKAWPALRASGPVVQPVPGGMRVEPARVTGHAMLFPLVMLYEQDHRHDKQDHSEPDYGH
jgi:hypothetical protein